MNKKLEWLKDFFLKLKLLTNQYSVANNESFFIRIRTLIRIYQGKCLFLREWNGLLLARIKELKLQNDKLKNELEKLANIFFYKNINLCFNFFNQD